MTTEQKAAAWDKLYEAIEKMYFDENGEELNEDEGGDLLMIGETCAIHMGFI